MAKRLTAKEAIWRAAGDPSAIVGEYADKWGETMGAFFNIAYALEARAPWLIPSKWRFYNPMDSGLHNIEDPHTRASLARINVNTLRRAGDILDRYCNHLVYKGLDY